jgi:predicted DNA-binding transcriptional regulator AlpA
MPEPNFFAGKISTAEVADRLGCHLMTVYRAARENPSFPKPIKVLGRILLFITLNRAERKTFLAP